jgi:hypothetical protein
MTLVRTLILALLVSGCPIDSRLPLGDSGRRIVREYGLSMRLALHFPCT